LISKIASILWLYYYNTTDDENFVNILFGIDMFINDDRSSQDINENKRKYTLIYAFSNVA